jgi:hypothetical protein
MPSLSALFCLASCVLCSTKSIAKFTAYVSDEAKKARMYLTSSSKLAKQINQRRSECFQSPPKNNKQIAPIQKNNPSLSTEECHEIFSAYKQIFKLANVPTPPATEALDEMRTCLTKMFTNLNEHCEKKFIFVSYGDSIDQMKDTEIKLKPEELVTYQKYSTVTQYFFQRRIVLDNGNENIITFMVLGASKFVSQQTFKSLMNSMDFSTHVVVAFLGLLYEGTFVPLLHGAPFVNTPPSVSVDNDASNYVRNVFLDAFGPTEIEEAKQSIEITDENKEGFCAQLLLSYPWMFRGCSNRSLVCNEETSNKIKNLFIPQQHCRESLKVADDVTIELLPLQILDVLTISDAKTIKAYNTGILTTGQLFFVEEVVQGAPSSLSEALTKLKEISKTVTASFVYAEKAHTARESNALPVNAGTAESTPKDKSESESGEGTNWMLVVGVSAVIVGGGGLAFFLKTRQHNVSTAIRELVCFVKLKITSKLYRKTEKYFTQ